jgi:hypothetical protein
VCPILLKRIKILPVEREVGNWQVNHSRTFNKFFRPVFFNLLKRAHGQKYSNVNLRLGSDELPSVKVLWEGLAGSEAFFI